MVDLKEYNIKLKKFDKVIYISEYNKLQIKNKEGCSRTKTNSNLTYKVEELENEMKKNVKNNYISKKEKIDNRRKYIKLKDKMLVDEELKKRDNFNRAVRRTQKNLFDLCLSNAYKYIDDKGKTIMPKFVTLTYREKDYVDFQTSIEQFSLFMKRLNWALYGTKKSILKYVCVPELQGNLRLHFHVVMFNLPYIEKINDYIKEIWSVGDIVHTNAIRGGAEGVARYMCKYMSKKENLKKQDQSFFSYKTFNEFGFKGMRKIYTSQKLYRCSVVFSKQNKEYYHDVLEMLDEKVNGFYYQENEYRGGILTYKINFESEKECSEFMECLNALEEKQDISISLKEQYGLKAIPNAVKYADRLDKLTSAFGDMLTMYDDNEDIYKLDKELDKKARQNMYFKNYFGRGISEELYKYRLKIEGWKGLKGNMTKFQRIELRNIKEKNRNIIENRGNVS